MARDPLAISLRAALATCAGCGWLAASLVLLDQLDPEGAWLRAGACLAWLVFAPLYEAEVAAVTTRVPRVGPLLARGVWTLEVLPIFLLPTPFADALIFGSMVLAQGHLFLSSEDDRNAARCVAAAPLVNVIALAYAPSFPLLCLLPLSSLAALTALVLLQGRSSRRRVRRGMTSTETVADVRSRLAYALPLGVLGLTLAVGLFAVLAALIEQPTPFEQPAPRAGGDRATGELPRASSGDGAGGATAPEMAFSGSSSMPFSDAWVMYVFPLEGALAGVPVHLRDMVLDTFTETSVRLGDRRTPPTHTDGDDGSDDGWTWLPPAQPGLPTREYGVLTRRLFLSMEDEQTLVFAPHPLAAVELASVAYHPDQVLFTSEVVPDKYLYGVRALDLDTSPTRLTRLGRSRTVDGRYLALPTRSLAMGEIERLASEWTRDAGSDYEQVRAIIQRLRSDFEYEVEELDFKGPEALLRFLQVRRGYCTYFASAAAMMLRTRGIPARVATGFLAHEWEEDEGRWIVRERDAHAWIEVAFQDVGWVTFDPTPAGAATEAAFHLLDEQGGTPWTARMSQALDGWLGGEGSLGGFVSTALGGPLEQLRRTPTLWLLPSALLLLLVHLIRRARRGAKWDEGTGLFPSEAQGLFQRLTLALARHGHRRREGQTPREFARGLPEGVVFAAVGEATELYYRARYGARPLGGDEERFVARLISDLEEGLKAVQGVPDEAGAPSRCEA
jgi:hypothetical protein